VLARHLGLEFLEQRRHLRVRGVRAEQHLEFEGLQLRGDVGGVVLRVRQVGDVLIGGIAEHQRDALALLGLSGLGRVGPGQRGCEKERRKPIQLAEHEITPSFEQWGSNKSRSTFSYKICDASRQRRLDSTRTEFPQLVGR
jgi:hypothetical protein